MQLHSSRQRLRLCSSWNAKYSVECVNKELVSMCAERRLRTAVAGTTPTGYAFNRAIWQGVASDFGCLGRQIPDSPMIKSIAPGRIRIMANNGETFAFAGTLAMRSVGRRLPPSRAQAFGILAFSANAGLDIFII